MIPSPGHDLSPLDDGPLGAVDLGAVAREVASDFAQALGAVKGSIWIGELPVVRARRPQMYLLITHLVDGAIKNGGNAPPSISIGADLNGAEWRVAVSSRGDAQPPSELCAQIVEGHGGRAWSEPQPGNRATVYFTLPR